MDSDSTVCEFGGAEERMGSKVVNVLCSIRTRQEDISRRGRGVVRVVNEVEWILPGGLDIGERELI